VPFFPLSDGLHRIVRINYSIRTAAFAYTFLVIGLHGWEHGWGPVFFVLLGMQFLVYPHLMYLRAARSPDPRRAEEQNLFIDATLLGAWSAALGFPTWIAYGALFSTALNATTIRGAGGALAAIGCFGVGAAFAVAAGGLRYWPMTSTLVTAMAFFGALAYTCAVGYVLHGQTRRLAGARDDLKRSEERYRMIAENAADLIAMVDEEGRWLYASPSYVRVLDGASLEPGSDAFRRLHPDDAERARMALRRAVATGKPRELALRLLDRDGRVRQYKARLQPLGKSCLLVSQDVTDLRDSEERLLLAAHALEGMTEAILITGSDGTILTVNRAFCDITGYSREEVLGTPERLIRNALQPPEFYAEVFATVARDGYWSGTTWSRRKNGSVYREWRSIRGIRDANGALTHFVAVFYEVGAPRAVDAADQKSSG
jgi:PAS domain S-box-containing protein